MWFLACSLVLLPVLVQPAPQIQFPFGKVQGVDKLSQDAQKPYIVFYGIPFAQPPINQLRFKPPQPFVGAGPDVVISSDSFRPACLHTWPNKTKPMSEDCLYLNVFTPPDLTKTRKVMFWVHGGAFQIGDAVPYVPSQLVTEKDVIVVTTQYRLGIFGFLTSLCRDGNNGLRDQILALKWTKDNIHQFGGDPNDITIFGESAGSGSVSWLSLSPLTKGLFTKAIMQSGTALSFWALNRKPTAILDEVSEKLGCTDSLFYLRWFRPIQSSDKIDCVRRKNVTELMSVNIPPESIADQINSTKMFLPVIDGDVIPRSPESLLADKAFLKNSGILDRKYILGFTNNEGLIVFDKFLTDATINNFTTGTYAEEYIRLISSTMFPTASMDPSKLDLLYYQYSYPRDADGRTSLQNLLDVNSDMMFIIPTVQFVRALTTASKTTDVFLYLFDHYPQLLRPKGLLTGSTHGADLAYEFDLSEITDSMNFYALFPQPSERNLTQLFLNVVSQFAKTGSPLAVSSEHPQGWPRYDQRDEYFFRISMSPKVDQHVYAKRVALWTDLVLKPDPRNARSSRPFRRH